MPFRSAIENSPLSCVECRGTALSNAGTARSITRISAGKTGGPAAGASPLNVNGLVKGLMQIKRCQIRPPPFEPPSRGRIPAVYRTASDGARRRRNEPVSPVGRVGARGTLARVVGPARGPRLGAGRRKTRGPRADTRGCVLTPVGRRAAVGMRTVIAHNGPIRDA